MGSRRCKLESRHLLEDHAQVFSQGHKCRIRASIRSQIWRRFNNSNFDINIKQPPIFPYHMIDLATPNQYELAAMHSAAKKAEHFESDTWWRVIDSLGIPSTGARDRFAALTGKKWTDMGVPLQSIQLLPLIPTILTKLGADGVLHTELLKPDDYRLTDPASNPYILSRCRNGNAQVGGVYMRLFPPVEKVEDVVSVNGVGDTFLGC